MKLFFIVVLFSSCQSTFRCGVDVIKFKTFDEKHIVSNKLNKNILEKYLSDSFCKTTVDKTKYNQLEVYIEPLLTNSKNEGLYYIDFYLRGSPVPLYKNRRERYSLLVKIDNNVTILTEDDEVANNKIYDSLLQRFTSEQLAEYKEDIIAGRIYIRQ